MDNEGPWQKLDPNQLRRDAEAQEAKLKKQQEQRLARAEARRDKRHAKSEAKKARKLNVQKAAKWTTPERKAAEKEKKLANRDHKRDKRNRRLRQRAEKLEVQAKKLWEEAQKARARADFLDGVKANEDEEKNKLKKEIEKMAQDPENEDYIPLEAPLATDGDSTDPCIEKIQKREDAKLQDIVPGTDAEKKRKRKEEKRAEKRKREAEENEAQAEEETEAPKERRKQRKVEQVRDEEEAVEAPAAKKDKKKKERKEHGTEETEATQPVDADEAPKEKKDKKKDKKGKKEKRSTEEDISGLAAEGESNTNGGEQWNVSALGGDSKRKEKFLRLLGGGKANGVASGSHTSTSKADIAKVQSDLERQFDVGMKMKHEGHSHRKGLGA
ncbi:hypothetical protein NUW58_g3017 [Xylaria curta]|uniref:Uncharacterized protein n=1 Tax=Xylaria curta TaxID=42375 RepID=A0ACC1PG04_9PEZI|nr:hypothetical protein NUW58_g3017 [Xylaria curta]